jgi:hypothetical protein
MTNSLQGKCSVPGCQFDAWRAVTGKCYGHEKGLIRDLEAEKKLKKMKPATKVVQ